jgi:hypothetical protein
MLRRVRPTAPPSVVLTDPEIELIDRLILAKRVAHPGLLDSYITRIAMLGGYLARKSDPPPGNIFMRRGMHVWRIRQLAIIYRKLVGNRNTGRSLTFHESQRQLYDNASIEAFCKRRLGCLVDMGDTRW